MLKNQHLLFFALKIVLLKATPEKLNHDDSELARYVLSVRVLMLPEKVCVQSFEKLETQLPPLKTLLLYCIVWRVRGDLRKVSRFHR